MFAMLHGLCIQLLDTEQIMSKIGEFRGIAAEKNRKLLEHNRHRPSQQKWDQNESNNQRTL